MKAMTRYIVVYDVSDDRARAKLAELLQRKGLSRIQRSAFIGELSSTELKDLLRRAKQLIDEVNDVLHIIPICRYDWSKRIVVGRPLNERGKKIEGILFT